MMLSPVNAPPVRASRECTRDEIIRLTDTSSCMSIEILLRYMTISLIFSSPLISSSLHYSILFYLALFCSIQFFCYQQTLEDVQTCSEQHTRSFSRPYARTPGKQAPKLPAAESLRRRPVVRGAVETSRTLDRASVTSSSAQSRCSKP